MYIKCTRVKIHFLLFLLINKLKNSWTIYIIGVEFSQLSISIICFNMEHVFGDDMSFGQSCLGVRWGIWTGGGYMSRGVVYGQGKSIWTGVGQWNFEKFSKSIIYMYRTLEVNLTWNMFMGTIYHIGQSCLVVGYMDKERIYEQERGIWKGEGIGATVIRKVPTIGCVLIDREWDNYLLKSYNYKSKNIFHDRILF